MMIEEITSPTGFSDGLVVNVSEKHRQVSTKLKTTGICMRALKFTITYFRVLSSAFICLFAVIGCYCYLAIKSLKMWCFTLVIQQNTPF